MTNIQAANKVLHIFEDDYDKKYKTMQQNKIIWMAYNVFHVQ